MGISVEKEVGFMCKWIAVGVENGAVCDHFVLCQ